MERKTFWLVSTDIRVGKTAFVLHHLSESHTRTHTIHYRIIYIYIYDMCIYVHIHMYIHIHVSLFLNIHTKKMETQYSLPTIFGADSHFVGTTAWFAEEFCGLSEGLKNRGNRLRHRAAWATVPSYPELLPGAIKAEFMGAQSCASEH